MSKRAFHTGQRVRFNYGQRTVRGVIKEDRGPIGMKGRVLYLIEFRAGEQSPDTSHIELPADQLEAVEESVPSN